MRIRSRGTENSGLPTNELPDLSSQPWRFDHSGRTVVSYRDQEFQCSQIHSPNGMWTIAFGRGPDPEQCRVFGFHDDDLQYTCSMTRPKEAWIGNDGTAIIVDSEGFETSGGAIVIVGPDGETVGSDSFTSNIHGAAITDDGAYAGVVTLNPDNTLSLYDATTGQQRTNHEIAHGRRHGLLLERTDSSVTAYIIDDTTERLLYAITADNEVVWESEYVTARVPRFTRVLERIRDRLRSS